MSEPRVIGVVPALERTRRRRLFDALEAAYPVSFIGRDTGSWRGLDAVLGFLHAGGTGAVDPPPVPGLWYHGDEGPASWGRSIRFADDPRLPAALRGARIPDSAPDGSARLPLTSEDAVLAGTPTLPVWTRQTVGLSSRDDVVIAPAELGRGEVLRNRLMPGRCLAMLALTQFLRDVTAGRRWELPPTRAAFVIDDPNLRWPTYGHVNYDELSRSAFASRYHVSIAMIPLDGWPTHPRAVAVFHARPEQLSLCIHGNDHYGGELGRLDSDEAGIAQVAQALRRVQAFERRTGLGVDRVMVPPHECVSEAAASALLACGYEALASTRTYPWLKLGTSPDVAWITRPTDAGALTGWGSATVLPGGLPLLVRVPFDRASEEVHLRAFLGQPVVLYGHHDLLEYGSSALESAAATINRLGDVRWSSLGGIARGAMEWRRDGSAFQLRMLGRRVAVDVPDWASEILVDLTELAPAGSGVLMVREAGRESKAVIADGHAQLPVAHPGRLELSLDPVIDPGRVRPPRWRLGAVAHRLAAEVRPRAVQVAGLRRASR